MTVEFLRLLAENFKPGQSSWLRQLVKTRSIWIMPNANALGYYKNVREENGMRSVVVSPLSMVPPSKMPSWGHFLQFKSDSVNKKRCLQSPLV